MNEKKLETITGNVETVVFHNETTGFSVLEIDCEGELITAVGEMPGIAEGEAVRLLGQYASHPTYGYQFKVMVCERELPATASAILKYLSSGAVKGIGPALARRIVGKFGDETLDVFENEPERLCAIKGISRQKAIGFGESYRRIAGIRAVMSFLARFGIGPMYSVRIFRQYGPTSVEMLEENPYLLCGETIGIDFDTADRISQTLGLDPGGRSRLAAGLSYVLRHNTGNGHTCLPRDKLLPVAAELLDADRDVVEGVLDFELDAGDLIEEIFDGRPFVYLPDLYQAERYTAGRVAMMASLLGGIDHDWQDEIEALALETGIDYAPEQRKAIGDAMRFGIMVLTGGPGTGKTTTLRGIIRLMEMGNLRVLLAAPTGRAAKRITELTGYDAKTIHRLLEAGFNREGGVTFKRDERDPLDCDAVILDEVSMVDIRLFSALLRALPLGCRLILVGDTDQLPPVGAGSLLRDLIDSERVPVANLTHVFRQAAESLITLNAHAIVEGEMPDLGRRDSDFFHFPLKSYPQAQDLIADLCELRLPKAYGFSPWTDIQVIAPGHGGELGTRALNALLQERLNPPRADKAQVQAGFLTFRVGDKVMQIRNNYDIITELDSGEQLSGIFNGDIGVIETIDPTSGQMTIRFDDRVAVYNFDMLTDLELAYAITVHKSQGSEFEAVILPLMDIRSRLYYRNLLYTGVTRAKRLLILIGREETIRQTVANVRRSLRYSHLKAFLCEEVDGLS